MIEQTCLLAAAMTWFAMTSESQLPAPSTDDVIGLHPRRITQFIWALFFMAVVGVVVTANMGLWASSYVASGLAVALLLGLWLVRKGRVRLAVELILGALTLSASYLLFRNQGIHGQAMLIFPAVLVFASMFATRRRFLILLAAIVLMLTAIVIANLRGWIVNDIQPVSVSMLIATLAILLTTAFFVWLVAEDLRKALHDLKIENRLLRESRTQFDILAHHDALTGLPNRLSARERLDQAIALARRDKKVVALLLLDLDDFKTVNNSLGLTTGDLLLCDVARRLNSAVHATDTLSRQGGDEFLVVMGGLGGRDAAASTALRLIDQFTEPFTVNGLDISLSCSLGISLYPHDGADFDTLMKNADVAMYRAKAASRNFYRFYEGEMDRSIVDTMHLISGVRTALARGEFRLHYQPQYELMSGRIIGAEALLRWQHPELGSIPPAKFIPVAEDSGLINKIGAWVLKEACRQAKEWQEAGLKELVVSVNVSPVQFRRPEIEREVIDALALSRLSPGSLELELTESLLIAEAGHLPPLLRRLRELGVRFSIDDFGTGYSNLGYLKRFEVERLKIDQSFVRRMSQNPEDESIVRAIIDVARSLNLEVVAEGIEDRPTLVRLMELGCKYGQGFYWSPGVPPDQLFKLVRTHNAT
jgi:diguanylate cyclase (GGDEF)-like protein